MIKKQRKNIDLTLLDSKSTQTEKLVRQLLKLENLKKLRKSKQTVRESKKAKEKEIQIDRESERDDAKQWDHDEAKITSQCEIKHLQKETKFIHKFRRDHGANVGGRMQGDQIKLIERISMTRLHYLFNIWPFTTINICPIA